jgi:Staphylococcal nuclease homologue
VILEPVWDDADHRQVKAQVLEQLLRISTLAALLLLAPPAYADVTGRVVGVHDGDTVTLLTADKHQVKIRAADIDAPELGQPFGTAARSAMSDLVYAKQVAVTGEHPDRYGRTVGRIVVFEPGSTVPPMSRWSGAAWLGCMSDITRTPAYPPSRQKPAPRIAACGGTRTRSRHGTGAGNAEEVHWPGSAPSPDSTRSAHA